ncbi:MAG: hypothetical protein AAFR45_05965 [Pseudomonadota bacterium]
MTWFSTLFSEGWPVLASLGLILILTIGALRPYLKKDRARRDRMEQKHD